MSQCRYATAIALLCCAALASPAAAASVVEAARAGDRAAVRMLLRDQGNANDRQADGTTALHWAVHHDDGELATLLVRAGADVDAANRYGMTPLSLAARAGSARMLSLLLELGADLRSADAALADGQTLLMQAARTGQVDAARLLIAAGADVNAAERRNGTTALMWAAAADRADAIRVLIEAGADVATRSRLTTYPHTPPAVIGDALEPGVSYVGQTVLPRGHWTALMYAARQGGTAAVRALASSGADLDARDPDGTSALIFAIINAHWDTAAALVEAGADPNVADSTGMTPLYAAVDMHTLASTFGRPDLKPTVVAGAVDVIRMLLAARADPNVRLASRTLKRVYNAGDPRLGEGATPLMRAARGADVVAMRLLLEGGADPSLTQKNGNSPILLAASVGSERGGNNPLRGSEQDALAAIELGIAHGMDVNAISTSGESAVHAALGSPAIVRLLVRHGSRLDVRNKQGRTPLEAALNAREPNAETVAVLKELSR